MSDIATIEELSIFFFCWEENGSSVEHFMEIFPLKRCDAETFYFTLIEYAMPKDGWEELWWCIDISGVQEWLKKHTCYLVHCCCYKLSRLLFKQQLALMGSSMCIHSPLYHSKHMWKPQGSSLKVLDLPELKITKPSDTRWLAHGVLVLDAMEQ